MTRPESCQHWLKSSRVVRDQAAVPIRWERYCETCLTIFRTQDYERLPDGGYGLLHHCAPTCTHKTRQAGLLYADGLDLR